MATVNHVGEGMIGLDVILREVSWKDGLNGKVIAIDKATDFLTVKWDGNFPGGPQRYACEKFETKTSGGKTFLVLSLG